MGQGIRMQTILSFDLMPLKQGFKRNYPSHLANLDRFLDKRFSISFIQILGLETSSVMSFPRHHSFIIDVSSI